jgi:hypothetical protein
MAWVSAGPELFVRGVLADHGKRDIVPGYHICSPAYSGQRHSEEGLLQWVKDIKKDKTFSDTGPVGHEHDQRPCPSSQS